MLALILCFSLIPKTSYAASIIVLSDAELVDAFASAASGDVIQLGADITFSSPAEMVISGKNLTLDCGGYLLTSPAGLIKDVEAGASISFVNAEMNIGDDNNYMAVVEENHGSVTIESTAGTGIVCEEDFVEDNYGDVYIVSGIFDQNYSVVYNNYGSVKIEDADVTAMHYVVGYCYEDAVLTIEKGTYNILDGDVIEDVYKGGAVTINSGTYRTNGAIIDDVDEGGVVTVNGGSFVSTYYSFDDICGTLIIKDAEVRSREYNAFYISDGHVEISGGSFYGGSNGGDDYSALYVSGSESTVLLSGGLFVGANGYMALEDGSGAGTITIDSVSHTEPSPWEGEARVEIIPNSIEIVFLDIDGTELYRETILSGSTVSNWPDIPDSPGEEYRWWGWVDSSETRHLSDEKLKYPYTLKAVFVKEGLPLDPPVPDDTEPETYPLPITKPSAPEVKVTSYDELKAAINSGETNILVSGSIEFPANGTIYIDGEVYITGEDGSELIGAGDFFSMFYKTTLTLDNVTAKAQSGSVVGSSGSASLNIMSGYYSAPDDAVNDDSLTLNIYSGVFEELDGFDGPLNVQQSNYINSKNISSDISRIEAVPSDKYTVSYYDGSTLIKSESVYEGSSSVLPEMTKADFVGWYDASDIKYASTPVMKDMNLYAAYATSEVTVTLMSGGSSQPVTVPSGTALSDVSGFDSSKVWTDSANNQWAAEDKPEHNITLTALDAGAVVKTSDEFKAAVLGTEDAIIVGAEIPVTETLVVDRSLSIYAVDGGSLIRPAGFEDILLSITGTPQAQTEVTIGKLLIDGKNNEAQNPAVYVNPDSTLRLKGTVIQNNANMNEVAYENQGGAVRTEGKVYMYEGTTLCSNIAARGGGIQVLCTGVYQGTYGDALPACFYMYGGDICHNLARDTDVCGGAGGGVQVDSAYSIDYIAFYMYGGHIHHNRADASTAQLVSPAHGGGVSLSCGDDGVHFIMNGGYITDNFATGAGGALFTSCSSAAMNGGVMARNVAMERGGAVATDCCDNTFYMYGGVITLNASCRGGGVESVEGAPYTLLGNVYGNLAEESGDDIYDEPEAADVRIVNDPVLLSNPYYIESEMQDYYKELAASRPDYISYDTEPDYPDRNEISLLPHLGWYVDSEWENRYKDGDSPIPLPLTMSRIPSMRLLLDAKALYGGFVLVYDANHGTGEYKYDPALYSPGDTATTENNFYNYDGYRFLGWNTRKDGTGFWFYPDLNGYNKLLMDSNKVLYAQWEKICKVSYAVNPDPVYGIPADGQAPTDGNSPYRYNALVTVKDNLSTSWTTSDGTAAGAPGAWIFTPWDKTDFNITEDTVITGGWTFTPNTYKVEYKVNGDDSWGKPSDSKTPSDMTAYSFNDYVKVEDDLTSSQSYAIDSVSGERVAGVWSFVSWDKSDFNITEDTVITGSWKFTPGPQPPAPGPEPPAPGPEPAPPDGPDTGDSSNVFAMMSLMLLSATSLFGIYYFGRKKRLSGK